MDDHNHQSSSSSSSSGGSECFFGASSSSSSSASSSSSGFGSTTSSSSSSGAPPVISFDSVQNVAVQEGHSGVVYRAAVSWVTLSSDTYYSISGVDSAKFAISSELGELSFLQAPSVASPVDTDADNIYELTLSLSSHSGWFQSVSQTLKIAVVKVEPVDFDGVDIVFPRANSHLGLGVDTTLEVRARVRLSDGSHANVAEVTANGVALERSSNEEGLWSGRISVAVGSQNLIIRASSAMGEIAEASTVLTNNALVTSVSHQVIGENGTFQYLVNGGALLRADFSDDSVKVISDDKRGTGVPLTGIGYLAIDQQERYAYAVSNTYFHRMNGCEPHEELKVIKIDLTTGDRTTVADIFDGAARYFQHSVWDIESHSLWVLRDWSKLMRYTANSKEVIYDWNGVEESPDSCISTVSHMTISPSTNEAVAIVRCAEAMTLTRISLDGSEAPKIRTFSGEALPDYIRDSVHIPEQETLFLHGSGSSGQNHRLYAIDLTTAATNIVTEGVPLVSLNSSATDLARTSDGRVIFSAAKNRSLTSYEPVEGKWREIPEYGISGPNTFAAGDLDYKEGTLALVGPNTVSFWDTEDMNSPRSTHFYSSSCDHGNGGLGAGQNRYNLFGGIALDTAHERYFFLELEGHLQDPILEETLRLRAVHLDGEPIDALKMVYNYSDRGFPGIGIVEAHLQRSGDVLALSRDIDMGSRSHFSLYERDAQMTAEGLELLDEESELRSIVDSITSPLNENAMDVSIIGKNAYMFARDGLTIKQTDTRNKKIIHSFATRPYRFGNYQALTVDDKNQIAYVLAVPEGTTTRSAIGDENYNKFLIAISLTSGERVLVPVGKMPDPPAIDTISISPESACESRLLQITDGE